MENRLSKIKALMAEQKAPSPDNQDLSRLADPMDISKSDKIPEPPDLPEGQNYPPSQYDSLLGQQASPDISGAPNDSTVVNDPAMEQKLNALRKLRSPASVEEVQPEPTAPGQLSSPDVIDAPDAKLKGMPQDAAKMDALRQLMEKLQR